MERRASSSTSPPLSSAVRVALTAAGTTVERADLGRDPSAILAEAGRTGGLAAYILPNEALAALARYDALIVDRGTKNPSKPLGRLLLGHHRIPLIRGTYTSAGQLLRSVRTLLRRAAEVGEHKVYLIGADPGVFGRLWARAEAPAGAARVDGGRSSRVTGLLALLRPVSVPRYVRERFLGESAEAELVRQLICRAALLEGPVLITGDTGTGKELVARLIHDLSPRRLQAFIPVNCGAIPRELFESELFGYERGAHSTATSRRLGLWRLAHGGTLFLDEIGDLSAEHQVKILRSLEDGEIRPLGAEKEVRADARVVAATNRDLFSMVQNGEFREDLYYRLRSFLVRTPSLRDQPEDIARLAEHFWKAIVHDEAARLAPALLEELSAHRWPGNARELRTFLSTLYGLFGSEGLGVEHSRAVFAFEGGVGAGRASVEEDEIGLHRVECLRHLRRVDEVLRAWRVAVRPVVDGDAHDPESLALARAEGESRLAELELLLRRPLLFHAEPTFAAVDRLAQQLSGFQALLSEDTPRASERWGEELGEEFRLALGSLFREVEHLAAAR